MIISNPHDHHDITIIPIRIIYNTISPWSYPTHMTINISRSSPSLSSTATPYHHDHIPPTWPSIYRDHPHPYHLQQHHSTMIISTHTTTTLSPSSPSLSSTATPYHRDHIPPTWPSIYITLFWRHTFSKCNTVTVKQVWYAGHAGHNISNNRCVTMKQVKLCIRYILHDDFYFKIINNCVKNQTGRLKRWWCYCRSEEFRQNS